MGSTFVLGKQLYAFVSSFVLAFQFVSGFSYAVKLSVIINKFCFLSFLERLLNVYMFEFPFESLRYFLFFVTVRCQKQYLPLKYVLYNVCTCFNSPHRIPNISSPRN